MKSNYRRLGDYIIPVKVRNIDLRAKDLLGININKHFMPSVANIVGTDLSNYKLVQKNQFACNRMHVGRDYRIPIAVSETEEPFMVSPAYDVFEIKDSKELSPAYLMMWFERSEFDRNAWFYTDADVRGGLAWQAFEDMLLPIPPIDKQREIVKEYNTIQNSIGLNQQIIQKLEETAQTIYRRWFVDFEFPDENGLPYKSNGGEMVWNGALGKEIPKGWNLGRLVDFLDCNPETLSSKDNFETILYLDTSNITNNKIDELQELNLLSDEIPSRARRKVKSNDIIYSTVRPALRHFGIIKNLPENLIVSTGFAVFRVKGKILFPELVYSFLTDDKTVEYLQAKAEMSVSTYPSVTSDDILNLDFVIPDNDILRKARDIFKSKDDFINLKNKENQKLTELKDLLLSKLATLE